MASSRASLAPSPFAPLAVSPGGPPASGPSVPGSTLRPRVLRAEARQVASRRAGRAFQEARARALTPLDEVRALDARFFADLPVPTVLELEVPGWAGPVWVRSAPGRGPHAVASTDPVFDRDAWRALVVAAASDRLRPSDVRALVERLARAGADDGMAQREIEAWMDVVTPSAAPLRVGQVLERMGVRLFSVRLEEPLQPLEAPAANGSVAASVLAEAG